MMRLQQDLGVVKLARDSEQLGGDLLCVRMARACRVEDPQTHQRLYELDRALELSGDRAGPLVRGAHLGCGLAMNARQRRTELPEDCKFGAPAVDTIGPRFVEG
jgi:hypothetical protein